MGIEPKLRYPKRRAKVGDLEMAYLEAGDGDPILFLHGNPTSSYLWRNVIPHLEPLGRCIAPDLVGMGDSDKLLDSGPERYGFVEHRRYLDALLENLGVEERVTLVLHDWGSALGFDWARRHPDRVLGIAYMESIVQSYSWEDFGPHQEGFRALRGATGEAMILEENFFVERFLPSMVIRELGAAEMAEYRRPYREPGEGRRPTLSWPRQIPIDGEPPEVVAIVDAYSAWLETSPIPKLLVNAEPGRAIAGRMEERCRRWPNQREVRVRGLHFVQEDSPDAVGEAVASWLRDLLRAHP